MFLLGRELPSISWLGMTPISGSRVSVFCDPVVGSSRSGCASGVAADDDASTVSFGM